MQLSGKTALVTGGAHGLGEAICRLFAARGATVAVADLDLEGSRVLAEELTQTGAQALAVALDVADPASVEAAAQAATQAWGRLDIWVNNAGIGSRAMLDQMRVEQWDRVLQVNLRGAFLGTQAAARVMMDQGSGRIINMSSRAAKGGSYGHVSYASSKAGMIGLTKSAARELGAHNITVNAILPGFIATALTKDLDQAITKPGEVVLPRPGRPEDVARAAAFLASDDAEWITGICLEVTGGSGMFSG